MYDVYQVKFNDTVDSIADKYNISVQELFNLNGKTDFRYGDLIVVPKPNNYMKYVILEGDTLYNIANKTGSDLNTILNINGLSKEDYIYPGETISIPKDNVGVYVTLEGDTLNNLLSKSSLEDILRQNMNIYLLPNQMIMYTKSN